MMSSFISLFLILFLIGISSAEEFEKVFAKKEKPSDIEEKILKKEMKILPNILSWLQFIALGITRAN